jgi:hypothetical protein
MPAELLLWCSRSFRFLEAVAEAALAFPSLLPALLVPLSLELAAAAVAVAPS